MKAIKKSISMRPSEFEWLSAQAKKRGHGMVSRVVQELIKKAMKQHKKG